MTPNNGPVVVALIVASAHLGYGWSPDNTHSIFDIKPMENGFVPDKKIDLAKHRNSALLLRFNANPAKLKTPASFKIIARAPTETGFHLSAVVEQVNLRKKEDIYKYSPRDSQNRQILALKRDLRSNATCFDYIEVVSQSLPKSRICGSWSLHRTMRLNYQGTHQNVIGNCDDRVEGNYEECEPPTRLQLNVEIGEALLYRQSNLSFQITITAFRHAGMGNPCNRQEFQCKNHRSTRCIWAELQCDNHFNCGISNADETSCSGNKHPRFDAYPRQLSAFDIVLYSLVLFAMVAAFGVLFYWQKQIKKLLGIEIHALPVPTSEEGAGPRFLNSVGALENGLGNIGGRPTTTAISLLFLPRASENGRQDDIPKNDMPPSYSSLFPDGPPVSASIPDEECYPYESVAGGATQSNANTESSQVANV